MISYILVFNNKLLSSASMHVTFKMSFLPEKNVIVALKQLKIILNRFRFVLGILGKFVNLRVLFSF